MKKKSFYKPKPEDLELNNLLTEERNLNAAFYNRMSGVIPWKAGERQDFEERFSILSDKIKTIMNAKAAEDFLALPKDLNERPPEDNRIPAPPS